VDRQVSITYGGLTLGGTSTTYRLTDPFAFEVNTDTVSLQATVIVSGTTEANFLSAESALVSVFNKPKGTLVVTLGMATRYTFSHSGNTGMNARASANKPGSMLDSGLAAIYVVSVRMERPWDYSGDGGLRNANISCTTGVNDLRTLMFSGQYSATSGNTALANYNNLSTGGLAVAAGWLSTFSILNADNVSAMVVPDKENKVCDFSLTYSELGFAKLAEGTHTELFRDPQLTCQINHQQFGSYSLEAKLPVEVEVTYKATVRFTHPIDLDAPDNLKLFILENLDPKIFEYVRTVLGNQGPVCALSRQPAFDPFTNTVQASYRLLAYPSALIELEVDTDEEADEGERLTPVWDGSQFAKDVQKAPRNWTRVVNIKVSTLQDGAATSTTTLVTEGADTGSDASLGIVRRVETIDMVNKEKFRLVGRRRLSTRKYTGLVLDYAGQTQQVRITFETWTLAYVRHDTPQDGFTSAGSAVGGSGQGTGAGAPAPVDGQLINRNP